MSLSNEDPQLSRSVSSLILTERCESDFSWPVITGRLQPECLRRRTSPLHAEEACVPLPKTTALTAYFHGGEKNEACLYTGHEGANQNIIIKPLFALVYERAINESFSGCGKIWRILVGMVASCGLRVAGRPSAGLMDLVPTAFGVLKEDDLRNLHIKRSKVDRLERPSVWRSWAAAPAPRRLLRSYRADRVARCSCYFTPDNL
ncbi:hypothetical protein EVAR_76208_1 [Eumeta japonica]|uniref:Uncharacterized protein n=1 Tax=Eumeta variegata TaxID=151549 RepID=A0A4C1UQ64_EUMVA|nr:hypothetical protein EVAR_76208_1 [Eumeta japonica]